MSTFPDLLKGTGEFSKTRLSIKLPKVTKHTIKPQDDRLDLECAVTSASTGETYHTIISFLEVKDLSKRPFDIRNSKVRVLCTCQDYYFTFAHANYIKGANFGGAPKEYDKKTDREYKNKNNLIGVCKHLLASYYYLKNEGVIT